MTLLQAKRHKIRRTGEDRVIDTVVLLATLFVLLVVLYPVLYILANAISDPKEVLAMRVVLLPRGFSLRSFEMILGHQYILPSYLNTLFYVSVGTTYSLALTVFGAYALSRKRLPGRGIFLLLITITMLFSGGMIPTYLVVSGLGLANTRAALILPGAVSAYYLIVMRTGFEQTPESLEESAKLDGANDLVIMARIILPVNLPVVVTIMLFYLINKWNDFFAALIYLRNKDLFPLQLILREILITASDKTLNQEMYSQGGASTVSPLGFRCAIIFISMAPMLIIYPFFQRYFVKGVMIGAIKG